MVTLLDYGAGNVRSVVNAITKLGQQVKVVQNKEDILKANKLVFPGVGSFGEMILTLKKKDLFEPLKSYLLANRPFLGICLGLQALFQGSEEAPEVEGLGIIPGMVKKFSINISVPHIGWNGLIPQKDSLIFHNLNGEEKFYFVHSYHVVPKDNKAILTTTDYDIRFVSAIQTGNIIATQFHPEKSGDNGLQVLRNFLELAPSSKPKKILRKTNLAKRIIACLDVRCNDQGDLVVTKGDQYDVRENGSVRNLGKPVDLAKRYYLERADEITFLNITGFRDFPLKDLPMLEVLRQTSENVFVPLTIGGGIRDYTDAKGRTYSSLEVASEYFRSGADKVSIGGEAVFTALDYLQKGQPPGNSGIENISRVYGNQAVVVSIDPRRIYIQSPQEVNHKTIKTSFPGPKGERYCWYQCTVKGGREGQDIDAITLAKICQDLGAGEILLNCIDRDGTNLGFDIELINAVKSAISIPVIASSGAGKAEHFEEVFTRTEAESALAAGIFHRQEVPIQEVKRHLKDKQIEVRG